MKGQTCSLSVTLVVTLLSVLVNGQTSTLTCKKCDRVASLDSCTGSQKCADNEVCYMDELITDQLTVVYTGGCRSTVVCNSGVGGSPSIGRRDLHKRSDLVACSRCCDIKKKSGELDCNARLCGIKYTNTNSTRCYLCDNTKGDAEQGDVDIPEDCLSETTCQPNEACGAERLDFSGKNSHKYTCLPKRICTLLTKEALKRKDECVTNPDPNICGNVGAGKRAATNQCTACCGDGLCNSGSCEQVLDRLYNLWKGGALDFDTLKQKSPTTTAKPTKPSPAATLKTTTQPPPPTKPSTAQTTQTTQPSTTSPTTQPPTTPTTPPTTATPTTQPPTTTPTTPPPTTKPTTQVPTTQAPTTIPTTQAPTTTPTTQAPTTTPTTQAPTTIPTTKAPTTTPTTQAPTTTPATQAPTTLPTTQSPRTTPTTQPVITTQTTQPIVTTKLTQPPVVTTQSTQPPPPTVAGSTAPQTPATAAVVVSQATSTLAPNSPPTVTPNNVVPPNTTSIIG